MLFQLGSTNLKKKSQTLGMLFGEGPRPHHKKKIEIFFFKNVLINIFEQKFFFFKVL